MTHFRIYLIGGVKKAHGITAMKFLWDEMLLMKKQTFGGYAGETICQNVIFRNFVEYLVPQCVTLNIDFKRMKRTTFSSTTLQVR